MIRFLDRTEERRRLEKLLGSASGKFCCLYGRRRCGKTRRAYRASITCFRRLTVCRACGGKAIHVVGL